jgi:nitric oxide reductase NorD protein
MEEQVGIGWHRLITRLAEGRTQAAPITLDGVSPRLNTVLRALGGDAGLAIRPATERALAPPRKLLQKIAGTGRRHALPCRDDEGLRLPARLDAFDDAELNGELALWLVALASQPDTHRTDGDWVDWNRRLCSRALRQYPGLADSYRRMVTAHLARRPPAEHLSAAQAKREHAVRKALLDPDTPIAAAHAAGDPHPVPLWLYPDAPRTGRVAARSDDPAAEQAQARKPGERTGQRKRAEYVEDVDGRDGLLVFRLESLFSWSEFIPLDRTADDDDEDAARTADDLDHLSIARNTSTTASRVRIDLDLPSAAEDDIPLGGGILLPEWDWRSGTLRPAHCRVIPMLPRDAQPAPLPPRLMPAATELRRRFESLRPQANWMHRQTDGEQLDLAACADFTAARLRGEACGEPRVWRRRVPQHRNLACLVLADLSLSTEAAVDNDHQVIDVVRDSLQLLGEALDAGGDAFAMYGFSSRRRDHVRMTLIKNFADRWGDAVRGRVQSLRPGYYTRMGAAIRQATEILRHQPAEQRLLLLLTDGKPNDLDVYEGRYGMEDTRHALVEARRAGLQPFCVTIDQEAADYLPHLFGAQRYRLLRRAQELPRMLPQLYLLLTGRNA